MGKKQHYVPRCYLKNFSTANNSKCINLFNLRRELSIVDASLRDQCYKDNFHGSDNVIENVLGDIEGKAIQLINSVISNEQPPKNKSGEHAGMVSFVSLQYTRTLAAVTETTLGASGMMKDLIVTHLKLKGDCEVLDEEIEKIQIKFNNLPAMAVMMGLCSRYLLSDLEQHLFVNETSTELITSDNPVVFYNSYLESAPTKLKTSVMARGLQIFFPLSPNVVYCLYDKKIYKYGDKNSNVTRITSVSDILEINKLQYINANENLYSRTQISPRIFDCINGIKFMRNKNQSRLRKISKIDNIGDDKQIFTNGFYREDVNANLNVSGIKILKKAKATKIQDRTLHEREPTLSALVKEFANRFLAGQYRLGDFEIFLVDIEQENLSVSGDSFYEGINYLLR